MSVYEEDGLAVDMELFCSESDSNSVLNLSDESASLLCRGVVCGNCRIAGFLYEFQTVSGYTRTGRFRRRGRDGIVLDVSLNMILRRKSLLCMDVVRFFSCHSDLLPLSWFFRPEVVLWICFALRHRLR